MLKYLRGSFIFLGELIKMGEFLNIVCCLLRDTLFTGLVCKCFWKKNNKNSNCTSVTFIFFFNYRFPHTALIAKIHAVKNKLCKGEYKWCLQRS